MLDTSVVLAGLTTNHEHHELARPYVASARGRCIAALVLAETFARLRGFPFHLDVVSAVAVLQPWTRKNRLLVTPVDAYVQALDEGPSLNLGGNIFDLLIVLTHLHHGEALITLDRRQAALARQHALEVTFVEPEDGAITP